MSDTNVLQNLLKLATLSDLKSFADKYAKRDDNFRLALTTFLAKKYHKNADTTKEYVSKMYSAFTATKEIGDRWYNFEITDWSAIMDNVDKIIKDGWKLLNVGNADTAALMAVAFFTVFAEEYDENEFLNYNEDECVDIGSTANRVGELLIKALTHPPISQETKDKVIKELKAFTSTSIPYSLANYHYYDFDKLITKIYISTQPKDDTLRLLDEQISQHAGQYDQHKYVERKLTLLRELHRDKEADETEQKYIYLSEIRKIVADRLLANKDFNGAIKQANEGIHDANEAKNLGIATEWNKYLLNIYQTMGDKDKTIEQLRHLFINEYRSRKEYYQELKKLIPPAEWKGYFHQLITDAKMRFSPFCGYDELADIYVEEGESEEIFKFLNSQIGDTLELMNTYSQYAGDNHAAELLAKYEDMLRFQARRFTTAKSYALIASSMKAMQKLKGGREAAHKLAVSFRDIYHRRRLMMKEIQDF